MPMPTAVQVFATALALFFALTVLVMVLGEVTALRNYMFGTMPSQISTLGVVQEFESTAYSNYPYIIMSVLIIVPVGLAVLVIIYAASGK